MDRKKIRKLSLIFCMMFAFAFSVANVSADTTNDWTRFQNSETNNGVTTRPGPTDQNQAVCIWENNMETPNEAKTPPVIVGDYIYTACQNKIYRLDKRTGKTLAVSDTLTGDISDALQPMIYADGYLYVMSARSGARIEKINEQTLKKVDNWCPNSIGQGVVYGSPLAYKKIGENGYLYIGTQTGNGEGCYACVEAETGTLVWSKNYGSDFYWDGAYVTDDYMVFASEKEKDNDYGALYVVDPLSGELLQDKITLNGMVHNSVVYDNGYLYVATMKGRLYRFEISDESQKIQIRDYIDLGGPVRAPVIVYNNRIYVGVGDSDEGKGDLNTKTGYYSVIDGSGNLREIYTVNTFGEPDGAPLLSVAENNKYYLYYTCNKEPGGIFYFTDAPGQTSASENTLFVPQDSQAQFCLSSLALDTDGTIYYKNDSNYVMAIAPKLVSSVSVSSETGSVSWIDNNFESNIKKYQLRVGDQVSSVDFNVTPVDTGVSCTYIVNGNDQETNGNVKIAPEAAQTEVVVRLTKGALCSEYEFVIYRTTADNTSLSLLHYSSQLYEKNLLEDLEEGKTTYSLDLRKNPVDVENTKLWIRTENSKAEYKVYVVENVKDPESGKVLTKDAQLYVSYIEKDGTYRYMIKPSDTTKNSQIRIHVTSADQTKTKDYYVKWIRTDEKPSVTPKPPAATTTTQKQPTKPVVSVNKKVSPPKKVTGFKAKRKKKTITLSWKKVKGASGYQITVAKDKKFRKSKKNIKITKGSAKSKKIKFTSKTKYVRIRAYVKKNGKTVYGSYSKTIKIK